jgi:hypothetical protein
MTRAERAAVRAQRLKEKLEAKRRELSQVEAQQRAAARAERNKRRFHVGLLADQAGLLVWDDATLARLFTLLGPLTQMPHPEAVLESLLADPDCPAREAVDGTAHAAHGVSPAC